MAHVVNMPLGPLYHLIRQISTLLSYCIPFPKASERQDCERKPLRELTGVRAPSRDIRQACESAKQLHLSMLLTEKPESVKQTYLANHLGHTRCDLFRPVVD